MDLSKLIAQEFKRRVFDESFVRIEKCLQMLSDDEIWTKPNDQTNSIGNLVLHLMGNARQYIISGLGGEKDERKRNLEFQMSSRCSTEELRSKMKSLKVELTEVINGLTHEQLTSTFRVQGFEEKGINIAIHVIEHFSYHVGQIALYTKLIKNKDLGFYAGLDLDAKSN